jgi:hypothetical protein
MTAVAEYVDITELENSFVICRTIGHAWDNNPTGKVNSQLFKESYGTLCLICTRCTAERFDYLGQDMKVWKRYYRNPKGYNTIKGQGSRPNLRAEMFRRSLLIRKPRRRATRRVPVQA